jgi:hypothetical protein
MFSAKLFIDKRTLPQKAGCAPNQLGRVVLKELVDNALDAGAGTVTLTGDATRCTVTDDGPRFDPDEVPRLFAVNPSGLVEAEASADTRNARQRAAGHDGRGRRVGRNDQRNHPRTTLRAIGTDTVTGATKILAAADMPEVPGVTVELEFQKPAFSDADYNFARQAITIARHGDVYDGPSMPSRCCSRY